MKLHRVLASVIVNRHEAVSLSLAWAVAEAEHAAHPCKGSGYIFVEFDGNSYRRLPVLEVSTSGGSVIFFETFGD